MDDKDAEKEMNYQGIIIEESLENPALLKNLKIISTTVEPVTEEHKTPWISKWTLHTVEIPSDQASEVAEQISQNLDRSHDWYADFKTETDHYIIFRDKVFHITDRSNKEQYEEAAEYGISLGIPAYQVDFSPHIATWQR